MLRYGMLVSKVGGCDVGIVVLAENDRLVHLKPSGPKKSEDAKLLKHLVLGDYVGFELEEDSDRMWSRPDAPCTLTCSHVGKVPGSFDPKSVSHRDSLRDLQDLEFEKSLEDVWPDNHFLPLSRKPIGRLPTFGPDSITIFEGSINQLARGESLAAESPLRCEIQIKNAEIVKDVAVLASSLLLSPSIFRSFPSKGLLVLAMVPFTEDLVNSDDDVSESSDSSSESTTPESDDFDDESENGTTARNDRGRAMEGRTKTSRRFLAGDCGLVLLEFIPFKQLATPEPSDEEEEVLDVDDRLPVDRLSSIFRLPLEKGGQFEAEGPEPDAFLDLLAGFCCQFAEGRPNLKDRNKK
mmetsp:Transcript_21320/g.45595  ORF Transcript_21320/g.45595 Transcript_21320/m.45595 type:complete len:352 (-) Transcript_21320:5-1060(-)